MTSRLNSYGHEVVHAENGAQAVEIFPATCPDLIQMDVEMPVMNGFDAASGIRVQFYFAVRFAALRVLVNGSNMEVQRTADQEPLVKFSTVH